MVGGRPDVCASLVRTAYSHDAEANGFRASPRALSTRPGREEAIDHERLSRTLAHALRHEPWVYELDLDGEGWASLPRLLDALRHRPRWNELTREDVEEMERRADKRRYEIRGDRIRARYGHSLPGELEREEAGPPDRLWHGTSPEAVASILEEGLRPMGRQHVHLSADRPTAREVGRRKAARPVLLAVEARRAQAGGVAFYRGNEKVWLADRIPARWLERM